MLYFDQDKIITLATLFKRAEDRVKNAEHIDEGIIIPSINELRYFGYHILIAMQNETNKSEVIIQLNKAESHAKRAIYDASEAIVIFYIEKALKFKSNFGSSPHITSVIPNYIELLKKLQSAQTKIKDLRESITTSNTVVRDQFYEECEPHIKELADIIHTFDLASSEIAKKDRKDSINMVIAMLAIVVAIVIGIWGIALI